MRLYLKSENMFASIFILAVCVNKSFYREYYYFRFRNNYCFFCLSEIHFYHREKSSNVYQLYNINLRGNVIINIYLF